jgi:hypothetical protein
MDSNAYSNNLNPNLPFKISPFLLNTLDLMEKGGQNEARLGKVHGCRHGGWVPDWFYSIRHYLYLRVRFVAR